MPKMTFIERDGTRREVDAPLEGCEEQLMRISVVVEVGETLKSQRCARL